MSVFGERNKNASATTAHSALPPESVIAARRDEMLRKKGGGGAKRRPGTNSAERNGASVLPSLLGREARGKKGEQPDNSARFRSHGGPVKSAAPPLKGRGGDERET